MPSGKPRFRSGQTPNLTRGAIHIPLTIGWSGRELFTLVDAEDYHRVVQFKWGASSSADIPYAVVTKASGVPRHHAQLANFIMRAEPGQMFDHASGDTLDNRKRNLRLATRYENAQNSLVPRLGEKTSKFKGVSSAGRKWASAIQAEGSVYRLGVFDSEVEAARAYDAAAVRLHGEFAKTNLQMRLYESDEAFVPIVSQPIGEFPRAPINHHPTRKSYGPKGRRGLRRKRDREFLDRELEKWGFDPDEFRAQQRAK